ncbi:MAG: hypothetical protein ACW99F_18755 [Candidatus Hodarchaeales archaeon]
MTRRAEILKAPWSIISKFRANPWSESLGLRANVRKILPPHWIETSHIETLGMFFPSNMA